MAIGMNAAWLQFYLGGVSDPLFCGAFLALSLEFCMRMPYLVYLVFNRY